MLPRTTFSRIINSKGQRLVDDCKITFKPNTNSENIREYMYPTHNLKRLFHPKCYIDIEVAKAHQSDFYDIIAELDEEVGIVNRTDKIPNIRTIDICPNDLDTRFYNENTRFGALRDFKLVDEFILAFIASDPVSTIAPDKNNEHPNSTTLLLSDISLQRIEEAKQRLRQPKQKINSITNHSDPHDNR